MKLISALLIILILGSFVPLCSDEASTCDTVLTGYTFQGEEDQCPEADLCSPFCSCHCCHGHTFQAGTLSLSEIIFFENVETAYGQSRFEKFVYSIWDPPKPLI